MIRKEKIPLKLLKQIQSLKIKKYREVSGMYISEGKKIVMEMLEAKEEISYIIACNDWLEENQSLFNNSNIKLFEISEGELSRVSNMKTPQQVMAISYMKTSIPDWSVVASSLSLFLDNIQDPGNVGTIIRLADWFGIRHVFCTPGCADLYNPKTIQATMGSFLRINYIQTDISIFFKNLANLNIPVYGAFLNGENIYVTKLATKGIIVLGNESKGISKQLEQFVNCRINIPSPAMDHRAESLNVAVAAAIVCSEFYRQGR